MKSDLVQNHDDSGSKGNPSLPVPARGTNASIYEKANYRKHIDQLLMSLDGFQTTKHASQIFQYLEKFEAVDDDSLKGEILMKECWAVGKFYQELKRLDDALEAQSGRIGRREQRTIAAGLIAELGGVKAKLNPESIKSKISGDFDDFYIVGTDLREMPFKASKHGVWHGFDRDKHLQGDIFTEYVNCLIKQLEAIVSVVEKFEEGYPSEVAIVQEKKSRLYPHLKNDIIKEERWIEFRRLCIYLSTTAFFIKGEEVHFMEHNAIDDTFKWVCSIPALAQFIKWLIDKDYLKIPNIRGAKSDIGRSYMKHFGIEIKKDKLKDKLNYLLKEMKSPDSDTYRLFFESFSWHSS